MRNRLGGERLIYQAFITTSFSIGSEHLRDAEDEFTARSRHWGGLLKSINVPAELEQEIMQTLDDLDIKLLASDPRFMQIAETIGHATEVAAGDTPGAAKLRMLPLNLWDLLARAGIVLKKRRASTVATARPPRTRPPKSRSDLFVASGNFTRTRRRA